MAVMRDSVELVIADQRKYDPGVTATQALEQALRGRLHQTHGTDPVTRAYIAVLRHPRQARFDAKEIERREQQNNHHHHTDGGR